MHTGYFQKGLVPILLRILVFDPSYCYIFNFAEDVYEVLAMLERGARRKQVAATALNRGSSRAHTMFSITVERRVRVAVAISL